MVTAGYGCLKSGKRDEMITTVTNMFEDIKTKEKDF